MLSPEPPRFLLTNDDGIAEFLRRALSDEAVIAVEHAARTDAPPSLAGCERWRERRQGDGAIAVYRRVPTDHAHSEES